MGVVESRWASRSSKPLGGGGTGSGGFDSHLLPSQGNILGTILFLDQVTRSDAQQVGTKAGALGELRRGNFNVPGGFILTTAAYPQIVESLRQRIESRLTPETIQDPAEIENAATEIREWIAAAPWTLALRRELEEALARLSLGASTISFAARTSTPSDDLETAFGSGVERAYLGLVTTDEVARAAAQCWAALWNSRAMYYRYRKKIPQTGVALAVLVQPMVHADAAGVLFTRNPMTGDEDEMQIDSIWGLGAPLTGARVRPDRFYVSKQADTISDRDIEEKNLKLVVGTSGHTEQQVIDASLSEQPSLTDEQVMELARLGCEIESYFGTPQVIEWARAGNKFWVLQARPISVRSN